jgi:hypothetical protein
MRTIFQIFVYFSFNLGKDQQWVPLNVIVVNGNNWLMESNWTRFSSSKLLFYSEYIYPVYSLIVIIRLTESVWVWPKVSLLSDVYCTVHVKVISGINNFWLVGTPFRTIDNIAFVKKKNNVYLYSHISFITYLNLVYCR